MTMGLSGLQPVSQRPEALPPMIEALIRVLVEALGLPLVQGLGYLFLHGLRLWRDPSEAACTVIGLLGWGGITLAVLAWLGTPYQRAVRRVPVDVARVAAGRWPARSRARCAAIRTDDALPRLQSGHRP